MHGCTALDTSPFHALPGSPGLAQICEPLYPPIRALRPLTTTGIRQDELPEGLLGTVRLSKLDLAEYKYLDVNDGMVYNRDDVPPEVQAWK